MRYARGQVRQNGSRALFSMPNLLGYTVEIIGLALSIIFVAERSYFWALWIVWLILSAFVLQVMRLSRRAVEIICLLAIVSAAASLVLPPNETDLHGWLRPGRMESPTGLPPFLDKTRVKGSPVLYIGGVVAYLMAENFERISVVKLGKESVLGVEQHYDGIGISARIFDDNGIVAEIVRNEFRINQGNSFRIERASAHELVVFDRWAKPVLSIEYLNREAIRVAGTFWHPEFDEALVIDATTMRIGAKAIGGNIVGLAEGRTVVHVCASGVSFGGDDRCKAAQ